MSLIDFDDLDFLDFDSDYEYFNFIKFPHDSEVEDRKKLVKLSGPVRTYKLETKNHDRDPSRACHNQI